MYNNTKKILLSLLAAVNGCSYAFSREPYPLATPNPTTGGTLDPDSDPYPPLERPNIPITGPTLDPDTDSYSEAEFLAFYIRNGIVAKSDNPIYMEEIQNCLRTFGGFDSLNQGARFKMAHYMFRGVLRACNCRTHYESADQGTEIHKKPYVPFCKVAFAMKEDGSAMGSCVYDENGALLEFQAILIVQRDDWKDKKVMLHVTRTKDKIIVQPANHITLNDVTSSDFVSAKFSIPKKKPMRFTQPFFRKKYREEMVKEMEQASDLRPKSL